MNRHGLFLRDMTEEQRGLAYALMVTGLTEDSNRQARLIIEHETVLGPLEQEQGRVTFVRFVVEYDNRQNGANHIHSVLRDVENDFAGDVLREHLLLYHVL